MPYVGLAHTSVVCGLLNAGAALASTWLLPATDEAERRALRAARLRAIAVTVSLIVALTQAGRAVELSEAATYPGRIVVATQSAYQRIVLVDTGGAFELYLSGNLQFSSSDEHRYHEALVHPAMAAAEQRRHVLIGGGGDGLAAREVLKWRDVETVTLVDLDPAMTNLARTDPRLVAQNGGALDDSRVEVINADAMRWLGETRGQVDVMIFDFPDPSNYSLGKLYSTTFYRLAKGRLATGGALAAQASSPFFARRSFWCIVGTIESAGLTARPYRAFVPSFGDWGFVVARVVPFDEPAEVPVGPLRFLSPGVLPALFEFPADSARVPVEVNRLNNQALVNYYLDEMHL
jgi:spermidine synthase